MKHYALHFISALSLGLLLISCNENEDKQNIYNNYNSVDANLTNASEIVLNSNQSIMSVLDGEEDCHNVQLHINVVLRNNIDEPYEDVLARFVDNNPGLLTDEQISNYSSTNSDLRIKLSGCDYPDFYKRNVLSMSEMSFLGYVDLAPNHECKNGNLEFKLLYAPEHAITTGFEELTELFGIDSKNIFIDNLDGMKPYIDHNLVTQEVADTINFNDSVVLIVSSGENPTVRPEFHLDQICAGEPVEIYRKECISDSGLSSLSWNLMIIEMPKSALREVSYKTRFIDCSEQQ